MIKISPHFYQLSGYGGMKAEVESKPYATSIYTITSAVWYILYDGFRYLRLYIRTMHNAPGSRQSESTSENKHRGANRSTKVAGKLKVLPEQPELVQVKSPVLNESHTARDDAAGGESEDGDISSDNDQEDAEVEVCVNIMTTIMELTDSMDGLLTSDIQSNFAHTRWNREARCTKTNQEKSKVPTSGDGIRNGKVR
jgi:hypothetical protein